MTPDAIVFWGFVAAWLVLAVLLLFVVLPRIVTQGRRAYMKVVALTDGRALPLQLVKARADAERLQSTLERVPLLQARAEAAVAQIRATPVVPPAIAALASRIVLEWRAFLAALR